MKPAPDSRPRVLVVSRSYPNPEFPTLGLWAERMVRAAAPVADCTVIAPVPWVPPLVTASLPRRFRRVPRESGSAGVRVYHPRILVAPGNRFHALDARLQYVAVRRAAERIHRDRPIDLIHAHFIYPDGVNAARLGRRLGVPVVTSEHALWLPWLAAWPAVRRQVLRAADGIARITAVSRAVEDTIRAVLGASARTCVVPNVVDETIFRARTAGESWSTDQLLFVGAVRHVKGLDVLVRAFASLLRGRPSLRLLVLGEAYYGQYRRDERQVRRLCAQLGVDSRVTFAGATAPAEVAAAMRTSAALVVPSRRESFSAVAIEALASGTPVVATRCGGPEEFLDSATGRLVAPDDPDALAAGIHEVLASRSAFDPAALRRRAVDRFGMAEAAARLGELYRATLTAPAR